MNRVVRQLSSSLPLLWRSEPVVGAAAAAAHEKQWNRGIRVRVKDGNLEQALAIMQRKMIASGMERLIRRQVDHHLKDSEKRVLARKNLQYRVRSQDLARKLRTILIKKIRGL
ncbi:uncharacterized protein [Elaeis guineensis]|uniref:Uncharacterized protein LOC105034999 n=1 Tax=Elaeis guineensis var. tenera TaxID=51953 RepID=A0A6I9QHE0_ELAGV|nr:uncharacterized protein LOC105034999 [Elaeis guineensis]XP_010908679.1 uncharacterized protein LOC105034999 [Elaeis guineensis]